MLSPQTIGHGCVLFEYLQYSVGSALYSHDGSENIWSLVKKWLELARHAVVRASQQRKQLSRVTSIGKKLGENRINDLDCQSQPCIDLGRHNIPCPAFLNRRPDGHHPFFLIYGSCVRTRSASSQLQALAFLSVFRHHPKCCWMPPRLNQTGPFAQLQHQFSGSYRIVGDSLISDRGGIDVKTPLRPSCTSISSADPINLPRNES